MNSTAQRILKRVAQHGDVSLAEAIALAPAKYRDHRDQYPLAMLIESEYLGLTINHSPPQGAEKMREYTLATTLHLFSLPKKEDGSTEYRGIISRGSLDPMHERVFLKAKGALYRGEAVQKRKDRLYSFIVGLLVGLCTLAFKTWLDQKPSQQIPEPMPVPHTSHAVPQPQQP